MEKINIAELLHNCPKGMELDCTMFDDVKFSHIQNDEAYPIVVTILDTDKEVFTAYGTWNDKPNAKCLIFPKGKTTWEGFVPPCKFKDGDIIADEHGNIAIYKGEMRHNKKLADYYCGYRNADGKFLVKKDIEGHFGYIEEKHLATEEEKDKLFQAIKDNGYKWNAETKTLEKLIEPKFKVGDRIKHKTRISQGDVITEIKDTHYILNDESALPFTFQDEYELIPDKFDITTLKPFDKVLVRNKSNEVWTANFYSHYDATSDKPFICVGWSEMNEYRYCIPYEVNNELLGTTNNTEEYGSR